MENLDLHLNSFATRCFRNVADQDYISARMCYRIGLISQFHWAALQAFEKYFKALLLYNRIKARDVGHDLALAQKKARKAPFKIHLSDSSLKLLDHINSVGRSRYLETSYYTYGPKLEELDKAVWELRRYCRVMDYQKTTSGQAPKPMLDVEVQRNEAAETRAPQEFCLESGKLEAIIKNRSHPARAPLIWQNAFYGSSRRKLVNVPNHRYLENSPLSLHPEILDHVLEYIHIPNKVADTYRATILNSGPNFSG